MVKIHVQNSKAGDAAVKEKLSKKMGRDKNERIISWHHKINSLHKYENEKA